MRICHVQLLWAYYVINWWSYTHDENELDIWRERGRRAEELVSRCGEMHFWCEQRGACSDRKWCLTALTPPVSQPLENKSLNYCFLSIQWISLWLRTKNTSLTVSKHSSPLILSGHNCSQRATWTCRSCIYLLCVIKLEQTSTGYLTFMQFYFFYVFNALCKALWNPSLYVMYYPDNLASPRAQAKKEQLSTLCVKTCVLLNSAAPPLQFDVNTGLQEAPRRSNPLLQAYCKWLVC